jgi:1,4-alpha-glucan branching enzyme
VINKSSAPVQPSVSASGRPKGQRLRRVIRFGLERPDARRVSVVGTFNNWNPEATPLRCVAGRKWFVYLPLQLGRHEYRFFVDGQTLDDPQAREFVSNPQGGRNAVLEVVDRPRA